MTTKNNYRELLIGCGNSRTKRIFPSSLEREPFTEWQNLTTLDIDPACKPDIVFDLCHLEHIPIYDMRGPGGVMEPDCFDEIHAYEVLEHCGEQGHYKLFFAQFREFWRILKPGGCFCATVPDWRSVWAWGDPSHSRVINQGTLVFLSQVQYTKQVGKTAMSDFRSLLSPADFAIVGVTTIGETFQFVLRAIK